MSRSGESNLRPSAYQPSALPPGQAGSLRGGARALCLCFLFFFFNTLLSLSGNSGRLTWVRLQPPQEQLYPVLLVHAGFFSCFHNPPNSDTEYRIFNVRTWSFLHGGWAHRQRFSTTFLTRKNSHKFVSCAPDVIGTSGVCGNVGYIQNCRETVCLREFDSTDSTPAKIVHCLYMLGEKKSNNNNTNNNK